MSNLASRFNFKPSALAVSVSLIIGVSCAPLAIAQTYTFTDLGTLGGTLSSANAINNSGQVAGLSWTTGNAVIHATLSNGITTTDLGTLGGAYSAANAINDSGQVAGWAWTTGSTATHATVWNGTMATDLGAGASGGSDSQAAAINNNGQVAGYAYTTGNLSVHATVWNGTMATDLNSFLSVSDVSAGWVLTQANGINDSGSIVGDATNTFLCSLQNRNPRQASEGTGFSPAKARRGFDSLCRFYQRQSGLRRHKLNSGFVQYP